MAVAVAAALAVGLVLIEPAAACPNCKDALAADGSGGDVVAGFFWSILFMMSMPFAILGTFSGYMYYEVRKARAAAAQQPQPPDSPPQANAGDDHRSPGSDA